MTRDLRRRVRGDRGFLTIWMIGLCILLLALGGVSVDLWHAFSQRQQLVGMADAAAVAGASGIDTSQYNKTGKVVLDQDTATALVDQSLASQRDVGSFVGLQSVSLSDGDSEITVTLDGRCSLFLLGFLTGRHDLTFQASSSATPRTSS